MSTGMLGDDPVPQALMVPERVAWARGNGLAQSIRATPELAAQLEADPCPVCRGSGRTGPRVVQGEVVTPPPPKCPECAGTGRSSVPVTITAVEGQGVFRPTNVPRETKQTANAKPIGGRSWLVVRLPVGEIISEGDEAVCRAEAKRLASAEPGEYAVFQPRGISRPAVTVTEELL